MLLTLFESWHMPFPLLLDVELQELILKQCTTIGFSSPRVHRHQAALHLLGLAS